MKRVIEPGLPAPTEDEEQAALIEWAYIEGLRRPELMLLYAVPNGGYRPPRTAAILKRTGVRPGVPDLCLPVARPPYHGLYIELKRRRGAAVSAYQKIWLDRLREQGYRAVVSYGWDEAREEILSYLDGGVPTTW